MATHTYELISGCSHRIPAIHFNAFKPGRNYVYNSENKSHALAIELLSSDSSFKETIVYTPEEEAVRNEQLAEDEKALAQARALVEEQLILKAAEQAEKMAIKAQADAQELREKADAIKKRLNAEAAETEEPKKKK